MKDRPNNLFLNSCFSDLQFDRNLITVKKNCK